ncbi:putative arginine/ornithine antiporter [Actinobacillus equuli]|nr:putative arginine/ornithine antiporter [Actinobacillus equuli]
MQKSAKFNRLYQTQHQNKGNYVKQKIGLLSLTALVLSSMIGSGIFSLPQNMAAVAGGEALILGWIITGIGIIFLGLSFFFISRLRPDLDGGIYTYAREGFGDLVGFYPLGVTGCVRRSGLSAI